MTVFSQICSLSAFCPISLSVSLCVLSEPFESKLCISGPFIPTNFSVFRKNKDLLSHNPNI